jgi:hypothetical protein
VFWKFLLNPELPSALSLLSLPISVILLPTSATPELVSQQPVVLVPQLQFLPILLASTTNASPQPVLNLHLLELVLLSLNVSWTLIAMTITSVIPKCACWLSQLSPELLSVFTQPDLPTIAIQPTSVSALLVTLKLDA